jgi:hypothetical protein
VRKKAVRLADQPSLFLGARLLACLPSTSYARPLQLSQQHRGAVVERSTWPYKYCYGDTVPTLDLGGDCAAAGLVANAARGASIGQRWKGYLWQSL